MEPGVVQRIALLPTKPSKIEFEGDLDRIRGTTLRLVVHEKTSWGSGSTLVPVWESTIRLGDSTTIEYSPVRGQRESFLEIIPEAGNVAIEPRLVPLTNAPEVTVRVRNIDSVR